MRIPTLYVVIGTIISATRAFDQLPPKSMQQLLNTGAGKLEFGSHVPGNTPARYCSDPNTDIFDITRLVFWPGSPRLGYYLYIVFDGYFSEDTGDWPWLNVTGTFNGTDLPGPAFFDPLCNINVFQYIELDEAHGGEQRHRSCRPGIQKGFAEISSPAIPIGRQFGFLPGMHHLRAEALTQDGRSIFCVEGTVVLDQEDPDDGCGAGESATQQRYRI